MALNAEQQRNAQIIFETGVRLGMDAQTIAAAIATAMMESRLKNNPGGDRDSAGLFQQRPSQGWGSYEQVTDPRYAAEAFFRAYQRSQGGTVLERIANTQRPAEEFRDHYARWFGVAEQEFSRLSGQSAPRLTGARPLVSGQPTAAQEALPDQVAMPVTVGADGTLRAEPPKEELPPDATPEQIEAYLRKHYPDVVPFLANEEIRAILLSPDVDDVDEVELRTRIKNTNYWKTHGPDSRAYDALLGSDPIAGVQLTETAKVVVRNELGRAGVTIDDAQLGEVAKRAIRNGWVSLTGQIAQPQLLRQFTVWLAGQQGGALNPGEISDLADKFLAEAKRYLVPITADDAREWAMRVHSGQVTEEAFGSWVQGLAKGRFDGQDDLVRAIDRGVAPVDFFRSHVNQAAQRLEISPDTIDLTDAKKWGWLTETVDENGVRRAPTLTEVDFAARLRPEYLQTGGGRAAVGNVGMGVWRFVTGQSA